MYNPTLTLSVRNAIMLALGLTTSTLVGAGGCADRAVQELCADSEIDYATCGYDVDPDTNLPLGRVEEVCFAGADGCDPCDAEAITGAAIAQADLSCEIMEIERVTLLCGPNPAAEDCCYKVRLEGTLACAVEGRPLLASSAGGPRLAALRRGQAWLADAETFANLERPPNPHTVELLRAHWQRSARYEHASVAAFARVGLQLLSLGAPPRLLRAVHVAMRDEVRHARLCFGLAAAYGGVPASEPGPLALDAIVTTGMDLETVVREAIFEGALGEGAAALEAYEGARSCEDPVVGDVLSHIAEDEQRHALLAYQTVQWALTAHPERARAIVLDCLREGDRRVVATAAELGSELERHGLLSSGQRARIRHQAWTGVVAPILATLSRVGMRPRPARHLC